ncbi:two-component system chemotaxis response regulator CheB [Keratinibaculum paraultunense]|uniref:Protein-glutamate methylesterase/protein-glutamine glutaminase n=1 Tax=Keratinibaculum paraultunense TaxID=1278232 RepID=A0A4R3KVL8_9FIRM|nr:chemotaxis response regulator protein-glutamate methylesterase [Keratinibaculum paraultunense]QQY80716.1 chemotaxis response regulator protein-glutamate methylesterase [Keratinibaculum paraultunense]TCS89679.1 two-component system chemotaxis response regulator CheB [Keratinibaculum paraultunense]
MIKLMIVDDSLFMRRILRDALKEDDDIIVVGEARNGKEALEKIPILKPDVITLDIEMPIMDGITTLKHIVDKYSIPVVMISSLTEDGAYHTLKALEIGAIDFITKPKNIFEMSSEFIKYEITDKIKAAAVSKVKKDYSIKFKPKITGQEDLVLNKNVEYDYIIAIATSTGGPRALQDVIPLFPKNINGTILVVQHMPANFTKSLADRLNSLSHVVVKEGEEGETLKRGYCYIAPGDYHMRVVPKGNQNIIRLSKEPPIKGLRPAADLLMESVAEIEGYKKIGVIMTGMGSDGAKGIVKIKNANGYTIAQDETTSVVFGMPKSAIKTKHVDKIVPLNNIAHEIMSIVGV